jgi:rubredoxin
VRSSSTIIYLLFCSPLPSQTHIHITPRSKAYPTPNAQRPTRTPKHTTTGGERNNNRQYSQANCHSTMPIAAKHNRLAVGHKSGDWTVVYYEPIEPNEPTDLTTPHHAPEIGLYSQSRGDPRPNDPIPGQVAWESLLGKRTCRKCRQEGTRTSAKDVTLGRMALHGSGGSHGH